MPSKSEGVYFLPPVEVELAPIPTDDFETRLGKVLGSMCFPGQTPDDIPDSFGKELFLTLDAYGAAIRDSLIQSEVPGASARLHLFQKLEKAMADNDHTLGYNPLLDTERDAA